MKLEEKGKVEDKPRQLEKQSHLEKKAILPLKNFKPVNSYDHSFTSNETIDTLCRLVSFILAIESNNLKP